MKKILVIVLAVVMVLSFAACSVGGNSDTPEKADESTGQTEGNGDASSGDTLKVGFIYIGAVNDGGYTQAQHAGTTAVMENFGDKVECKWLESIDDTNVKAAEEAAKQLIDWGANVVVGTSFGFGEALEQLAKSGEYEDITFLHFSGSGMDDNMGNYFGAMEEPRYLSGIIAGMQSTSGKLGYVAAYPYTEVKIGINAFTLGAQSVNPAATVQVVYINSWYDPAKEKEAAESLLAQGCDVITQHADTVGPQLAAADAGKFTIGYNLDNSKVEGLEKAYLTAPIWHHEKYLIPALQSIMDKTWKSESYYGSMADGYISLAPLTANVTAEARAKVEEAQAKIIAGEQKIFTGPILDNKGAEVVKSGETLDRAGIWKIEYLVKGVSASE